jgi:hypothetical protein
MKVAPTAMLAITNAATKIIACGYPRQARD